MPAPYLGYQPNILVIRTDDAPLDCYSATAMPTFAATYASQFITCLNAVCVVALCCPSRVAGLTGKTVFRTAVADNVTGGYMDTDGTFLAAVRRTGDYYTGAVGKFLNPDRNNNSVFARNDPLGCDERYVFKGEPAYYNYTLYERATFDTANASEVAYGSAAADYCTRVEGQHVLDIMGRARTAGKKWCIYWAPKCCHQDAGGSPIPDPLDVGVNINLTDSPAYGKDPADYDSPPWMIEEAAGTNENDIRNAHKEALRCMRSFDRWFDLIMQDLNSHGELSNTVIILTTDNMHEYYGMKMDGKGSNRREATGMNMLVRMPSAAHGGETRNQAIGDIDIAPTVCALAGARLKDAPDGMNFWPAMENSAHAYREGVVLFSNRGGVRYLGFWDNTGYSSAVGLNDPGHTEGQQWGWNDFYMLQNIGPSHAGMVSAQLIVDNMRKVMSPNLDPFSITYTPE